MSTDLHLPQWLFGHIEDVVKEKQKHGLVIWRFLDDIVRVGERTCEASMAGRTEGYYWIIDGKNEPEVAAWSGGYWWLTGFDEPMDDEKVVVLGDRLATPSVDGGRSVD